MPASITLACQTFRCDIAPHLGGCITGLWLGELAVLRGSASAVPASARQAGSYALVPFSNRVGYARLRWGGLSHALKSTAGDEPHAIHGVGWQRPWRVCESSAQSARLSYAHQPDAAWPFAFDAVQTFRLSAKALTLGLRIENRSALAAPVGLGWHPYFVKRQHSHIAFAASGRWEMGADQLPTHRIASHGLDAGCASLTLDHCYDGWPGVVHLRDEQLHTRISSSLNRLVVFTSRARGFVAIEPVSHVNNAFNLMAREGASAEALGVHVLQPGQSLSAEMCMEVARAGSIQRV